MIPIVKNSVRAYRLKSSLTQVELAEKVGVTRQTIGLIEKEKYNPTMDLAFRIAKVLTVPIEQLFWFKENNDE